MFDLRDLFDAWDDLRPYIMLVVAVVAFIILMIVLPPLRVIVLTGVKFAWDLAVAIGSGIWQGLQHAR